MIVLIVVSSLVAYPLAIGLWLEGASLTFSILTFYVVALTGPAVLVARAVWRVRTQCRIKPTVVVADRVRS